jgi:hypothetical protein
LTEPALSAPRAARVFETLAWTAFAISALAMGFTLLGLLSTVGRQCTPSSQAHGLGDTLTTMLVALGVYALPAGPAALLLYRLPRSTGATAGAFALMVLAVFVALLELVGLSLATMC